MSDPTASPESVTSPPMIVPLRDVERELNRKMIRRIG